MATTKKEGWTGSIRQWGNDVHSQEVICSEEPPFLDRRTYKAATVVIHEGERELVFTESEVRAMLIDLLSKAVDGRSVGEVIETFQVDALAEEHFGIILNPA